MTDQPGSATSVALTATASCTAFCGRDELSSDALKRGALAERVEWLAEMAAEVTRKLVMEHFTDADIKRLGKVSGALLAYRLSSPIQMAVGPDNLGVSG